MIRWMIILLCLLYFATIGPIQARIVLPDSLFHNELPYSPKQLIAPTMFIGTGLLTGGEMKKRVANLRNNYLPSFYTDIDDPLSLSPLLLTYVFEACGMHPQTDFWNRSAILVKAELMMLATVYPLKWATIELRPDGSDNRSFPSSHTAQAFLGATMLSVEYGQEYKWIPYFAYSTAAVVGVLRIANNKHYLPDILVGAGLGILSQRVAYWTHRYRWAKKNTKRRVGF